MMESYQIECGKGTIGHMWDVDNICIYCGVSHREALGLERDQEPEARISSLESGLEVLIHRIAVLEEKVGDKTKQHVCKEDRYCTCSMTALEPSDECSIHGYISSQPRCECGRFVKRVRL